ncbi:hypothetical protein [Gordonia desulfuricans]|nr:hypothetical protein [Gordonia desulfuricans]
MTTPATGMHSSSGPTRAQRLRMLPLGIVPPVAAGAVAVSLLSAWRPDLPDPIASHWGSHGVDGTSSITGAMVMAVAAAVIGAVIGGATCWWGRDTRITRTVVALVNFLAVVIAGIAPSVAADQRGVTDIDSLSTPVWPIVITFGVAVLVAVASAALIPTWTAAAPDAVGVAPLGDLAAGEQFFWRRNVSTSPWAAALVGVVELVLLIIAVAIGPWWLLVPIVVVLFSAAALWSVRVTVDRRQIEVRGILGRPRRRIPMDDVVRAEVVPVRALADFGGYGFRLSVRGPLRGAQGFVLRSGPGLLLTRSDGRRDVVVVDDADIAAGLINAGIRPGADG